MGAEIDTAWAQSCDAALFVESEKKVQRPCSCKIGSSGTYLQSPEIIDANPDQQQSSDGDSVGKTT